MDDSYFRGLIQGMRCGIVTIDRRGSLVMLNEHAGHILGLSEIPSPGLPLEAALGDHPQLVQILRESFTMSSLPNRAEIDLRCRTDRGKTIGFTLSLVPGQDGAPVGAAIFFKDLTHVEHKEEQERLKDRLAALGQMSANLAHEIRNPLAAIEVSCSLLKRRLRSKDEGTELLEKIIGEVRRLNNTISSSLEFVRPLSLSLNPTELVPLLEEALVRVQERHHAPGIRVVRRYDGGVPSFLMDRGQILQVFENLLLNAFEAMGEEGVLTLETGMARAPASAFTPYRPRGAASGPWPEFDHYVVVRVKDAGPGIPDEHREKLFYPFFTTKKQGSGVGLAMARKAVDSHRGLLDVESGPGGGAIFTVRLPLVRKTEGTEPR